MVKGGIEDRDLRHGAAEFFDERYAIEFQAIVKRREDGHLLNCRFDFWRDEGGLMESAAAVDDAVTRNSDFRNGLKHGRFSGNQFVQ